MLKSPKPFFNKLSKHPEKPCLRIGRQVPKHAVNLGYYYNPTAAELEKILSAESPRNTIDHRVEEAYRFLTNQSDKNDDLFPAYVIHEDEEGYYGQLSRIRVQWKESIHSKQKQISDHKQFLVTDQNELPQFYEYSDEEGYTGSLFLDTAEYTVTDTKEIKSSVPVKINVDTHEISYHKIFNKYLTPGQIDAWMIPPSQGEESMFPAGISIHQSNATPIGECGNEEIKNYIENTSITQYDGASGDLLFDHFEYEPIRDENQKVYGSGTDTAAQIVPFIYAPSGGQKVDLSKFQEIDDAEAVTQAIIDQILEHVYDKFKENFSSSYSAATDSYNYTNVKKFLEMVENPKNYDLGIQEDFKDRIASYVPSIQNAMDLGCEIIIERTNFNLSFVENGDATTEFSLKYACDLNYRTIIRTPATQSGMLYNVIAVYAGTLDKSIETTKEIATEWKADVLYTGVAEKVWNTYDGMAYYRGSVTKGNDVGNMNPNDNNEILMFADENGYLRRPVVLTDEYGNEQIANFYRLESEYVYLTNVFKDGIPCFYRHVLNKPIYDYRTPDESGYYGGSAVKIFSSDMKDIPSSYKYILRLKGDKEKGYTGELFTSFISDSTDTFKAVYHAFIEAKNDSEVIDNNTVENVFGYPFLEQNHDFKLVPVNTKAKVNMIKLGDGLKNQYRIEDTRHYVTFQYKVKAVSTTGEDRAVLESRTITASILNRDYALPAEYDKFIDRAMIVSPRSDGYYKSPYDLLLEAQASQHKPIILTEQTRNNFTYYVEFVSDSSANQISDPRSAINLSCNPDGSGMIVAETTIDTGFKDPATGLNTKKLDLNNPYLIERGYIYPGFQVKCVDSRHIKVLNPREERLLDSWYPCIQYGHYSQILDQYGTHTKVCYTLPEYDTQIFSEMYGKPYVDTINEKPQYLNSHTIKAKCFPLLPRSIKLFKVIDENITEEIKIKEISFSDGVIYTQDTISENDNLLLSYAYLESNYIYRGFWRNQYDFCKIDLNPNIYHTFSDIRSVPAKDSPTKNLFNKVIYFFLKPTVIYEIGSDNDSLIFDIERNLQPDAAMSSEFAVLSSMTINLQYKNEGKINSTTGKESVKIIVSGGNNNLGEKIEKKITVEGAQSLVALKKGTFEAVFDCPGTYKVTVSSNADGHKKKYERDIIISGEEGYIDSESYDCYFRNGIFDSGWIEAPGNCSFTDYTFRMKMGYRHDLKSLEDQMVVVGQDMNGNNYILSNLFDISTYTPIAVKNEPIFVKTDEGVFARISIDDNLVPSGNLHHITRKLTTDRNETVGYAYTDLDDNSYTEYLFSENKIESDETLSFHRERLIGSNEYNITKIRFLAFTPCEDCPTDRGAKYSYEAYYNYNPNVSKQNGNVAGGQKEDTWYSEFKDKILIENENCLYHKIDDPEPDNAADIYIGSVYIRQNTSLESTVIIDSRTRGGGLVESLSEDLRHQLEPESDYYMDIGYYDGKPYQENGVIIVRLDNSLLKEFGGRFSYSDIESKVKRWAAYGVYPIIEYVDAYSKREMPQYTLKTEEIYPNTLNITPEIFVKCLQEKE